MNSQTALPKTILLIGKNATSILDYTATDVPTASQFAECLAHFFILPSQSQSNLECRKHKMLSWLAALKSSPIYKACRPFFKQLQNQLLKSQNRD